MTNKTSTRARRARQIAPAPQPKQRKAKKATPFSDVGSIVGSAVGGMFGAPYLKGVGKWLGSGIGSIFGSGDYQLVGSLPDYNVMMNGNQIPKFSTTKQTNVVCHREYLQDIDGTAGFNIKSFPLNPGMAKTFPWLSTVAQNYQEYKIHGIIFEFRPLITDFVTGGAPGVVIMATNYNADAPPYSTKQEMENSEYAVSVKPTKDLMHGVECATNQTVLSQLYVRSGEPPTGQDKRLYDLGNFMFATQQNPLQNLGELWVSYCVEFFKPILPADVGGNVPSVYSLRNVVAPATPFGGASVVKQGDLESTITPTSITFYANPGNFYTLTVTWTGSIAAIATYPATTLTGLTAQPIFGNGTAFTSGPNTGTNCLSMTYVGNFKCTALAPSNCTITLGILGSYPTGATSADIILTGVSTEMQF